MLRDCPPDATERPSLYGPAAPLPTALLAAVTVWAHMRPSRGRRMAGVFLSYDHEDMDRAAPIAAALENAGHTVWWDRQIHGGAEYNSEIEGAVAAADVVVVLWTERSVRSGWVRDEAAEGRDRGKLVPVALDATKPPMGFRQYQTIRAPELRGRKRSAQIAELLNAIQKIAGSATSGRSLAIPAPQQLQRHRVHLGWVASGAIIFAVIAISVLFWRPWASSPGALAAVVAADLRSRIAGLCEGFVDQTGPASIGKARNTRAGRTG